MSQAPYYDPPRRLFSPSTDGPNPNPGPNNPTTLPNPHYNNPNNNYNTNTNNSTTLGHSYNDSMTDFQELPPPVQPYRDNSGMGGGLHQRNASAASAVSRGTGVGVGAGEAYKDEFDPFQPPPRSTGDLRMWRRDHHGNMWLKGGRGRCIGRFCCCTIMTVVLLLVSVVLTLAMFLRPPDIEFGGIQPASTGSTVEAQSSNLTVNLGIKISVRNPNYFSVTFKSIKVSVNYPIGDTQIGGGEEDRVVFPSNSKTSFTFPFQFRYSVQADPNQAIIKDLFNKCGFMAGGQKEQISLKYTLELAVQILFVTISPPIEGTASFDCPFSQSDVQPLIDSIPGLKDAIGQGGGA